MHIRFKSLFLRASLVALSCIALQAVEKPQSRQGTMVVDVKPDVAISIRTEVAENEISATDLHYRIDVRVRLNRNANATLSFEEIPLPGGDDEVQNGSASYVAVIGSSKSAAFVLTAADTATIRESGQYFFSLRVPARAENVFLILKASDDSLYVRKQLTKRLAGLEHVGEPNQ